MSIMEYCEIKNRHNLLKHGISFSEAAQIFDDPHMLSWLDERYHYHEERWIGLGKINSFNIIVIIHTLRVNEHEEQIIRIISARKANKKETAYYFEKTRGKKI